MPKGVKYISQAADYMKQKFPMSGKNILDKDLTGCGGTEFFGNSGLPLVLVSPRTGVLFNKSKQHHDWHLFLEEKEKFSYPTMDRLRMYLDTHYVIGPTTCVILVTWDSAHHVINELKYRGIIDNFLFLVDEFQCLMGDAAFKGKVELDFLRMLNMEAKNICYMSATPIQDTYLDVLPEFQGVDYYKLNWDPDVVVEPTVKKILMQKGEGPVSIMEKVIDDYILNGYFAKKIDPVKGEVKATELVVFVNEVKTIWQIIVKKKLKPDEVTLLISHSSDYVKKFKEAGFEIDSQIVDRDNPQNKTYTFCSKASFEGRDFYSLNAFTIIFLDGTKEWQTHSTSIEVPQMLGRQRLDENPFRYNAIIYFKTKPNLVSKKDYMQAIEIKMKNTESYIKAYESTMDAGIRAALMAQVKAVDANNPYKATYLDVVNNADGTYTLGANFLVAAAEHMMWANKEYYYSHPIQLTTAINQQMATCNQKTQELRDFEEQFDAATSFTQKMMLYCNYLANNPNDYATLLANPFIDEDIKIFYKDLGPARLQALGYDEGNIRQLYKNKDIDARCKTTFIRGQFYTMKQVKSMLQGIYNDIYSQGPPNATAKQLEQILPVKRCQRTMPSGMRTWGYEIL